LPLPLVSRMNGVQPCDFTSSPVSSNIFRFSQPTTWLPVGENHASFDLGCRRDRHRG
jgi:hypothetical protein